MLARDELHVRWDTNTELPEFLRLLLKVPLAQTALQVAGGHCEAFESSTARFDIRSFGNEEARLREIRDLPSPVQIIPPPGRQATYNRLLFCLSAVFEDTAERATIPSISD